MDLSARQSQTLKAIVEEYIATAEPVGSQVLEKKYNMGVSPATLRNEMVALTDKGYLRQPHTSAGRIPTSMGLRFFVDHLMQEKKLSVAEEVSAREQIWDSRLNFDRLMRQTTLSLAARTKTLSIVATDTGDVYYSGVSNILNMPEFFDIDVAHTVLSLLDQESRLRQLFFEGNAEEEPIHIIFGQELGWPYFEPVGVAFTRFSTGQGRRGTLGIIGPCRLNYPYVLPILRYYSGLITQMTAGW